MEGKRPGDDLFDSKEQGKGLHRVTCQSIVWK